MKGTKIATKITELASAGIIARDSAFPSFPGAFP